MTFQGSMGSSGRMGKTRMAAAASNTASRSSWSESSARAKECSGAREHQQDHDQYAGSRRQDRLRSRQYADDECREQRDLGGEAGIHAMGLVIRERGERDDAERRGREQQVRVAEGGEHTDQRGDGEGAYAGGGGPLVRLHAALAFDSDQQAGAERNENSRSLRRQSPFIQVLRHRSRIIAQQQIVSGRL